MTSERVLVPISRSVTVRQTIGYAVRSALESDPDEFVCHLVAVLPFDDESPQGDRQIEQATTLLERAAAWVREDAGDTAVTVETAVLGIDAYLFSPEDYASELESYAREHDITRLVLDPEYRPGATAPMIQPLERELRRIDFAFEEAPVERPATHERLAGPDSRAKLLSVFGVSYAFYLVLGDPTYWFDLVTGAVVGAIVALTLSQVTFTTSPTLRESPLRVLRFGLYVPYLIVEIIKANIAISLVILRPSMPIEPRMTRVRSRVRSGLPLLSLANSITLTPGTLTVRANDQRLIVHTLIPDAREDLFDGRLERAVRFVFHGRQFARIPTPRERGDTEVLGGEEP